MAEAERYLPSFLDALDGPLRRHGLENEPLSVRITGCPNGCARPFLAEIALVGKAPERYNLYLGGDGLEESRLLTVRPDSDDGSFWSVCTVCTAPVLSVIVTGWFTYGGSPGSRTPLPLRSS